MDPPDGAGLAGCGEDGLFPGFFGRVTGATDAGRRLVAAAVLVTVFVFMNYTSSLVDQFTFMLSSRR